MWTNTGCGKNHILQGDILSRLVFVLGMIPVTKILRKARAEYVVDDIKVNHLLSMDDLKLFAKNEKDLA